MTDAPRLTYSAVGLRLARKPLLVSDNGTAGSSACTWVAHDDVDRATIRREPTVSIKNSAAKELKYVGLDVHKDSITSSVLEPGHEVAVLDRFFHDEVSVRRFVSTLGDPCWRSLKVAFCNHAYSRSAIIESRGGPSPGPAMLRLAAAPFSGLSVSWSQWRAPGVHAFATTVP